MSKDLNRVQLIGRLTGEPKVIQLEAEKSLCLINLATNYSRKGGGEDTQFHKIIAWNGLAAICGKYLKKGSLAFIEGRLQNSSYEVPEKGIKDFRTEIVAQNLILLDRRSVGRADIKNDELDGDQEFTGEAELAKVLDELDS